MEVMLQFGQCRCILTSLFNILQQLKSGASYRQVKWLCTPRRVDPKNRSTTWPGSIHDTDRIPYRCFLPDLTRFETVCCAAAGQNDLIFSGLTLREGFSPA
jgi:hypothetical protein